VIGQKVVYLYPSKTGNLLAAGSTLPLTHDVSDASVDALLNSLGPFLESINPRQANTFVENVSGALQNDTAEVDQLIDNGATVAQTVGNLNTEVGTVIDSLDKVLTAIASRRGDLTTLVTNLQTVSQSLAGHNGVLEDVVNNLSAVSGDLADLVTTNRSNLDGSIADLNAVTSTLAQNQQELAHGLSTLGQGLAPYTEISSWGQWFQIQTVYTCLANETSCSYYEPTNAPSGSGVGGGLPTSAPAVPGAPGASGFGPLAQSSIPQILATVGGAAPPAATGSAP
jgi:phospholipid/cholesterol/gamma-HCH transport system substrate-binding protein